MASDIYGPAKRVGTGAGSTTGSIMIAGTVGRIQHERYAGNFAGSVQLTHRSLLHVLERAGWRAGQEFTF